MNFISLRRCRDDSRIVRARLHSWKKRKKDCLLTAANNKPDLLICKLSLHQAFRQSPARLFLGKSLRATDLYGRKLVLTCNFNNARRRASQTEPFILSARLISNDYAVHPRIAYASSLVTYRIINLSFNATSTLSAR